jgi:hypothetical protein
VSFADLEARVNTSAMQRVANAIATPLIGDPVSVIFDRAHIEVVGGLASASAPLAQAFTADIEAWVPHETQLAINGLDYILRDAQPDGTGWSLLILEAV